MKEMGIAKLMMWRRLSQRSRLLDFVVVVVLGSRPA